MISLTNVTKCYGNRLAVDGISFSVKEGEIVGFLGPNGAGKTTTMRMIAGYLTPTHGQVWVGDCDMTSQSLQGRRMIGYLPEMVPLYTDMTTRSYLEFTARLRGVDKKDAGPRVEQVMAECGLEDYVDVLLRKMSKGFKQRVGLAQAIVHDPQVLILDEPTVGIDPIQVAQTRQLIRTLGQNRTIVLSTHILPEVSMICERVIIIHEGRIVAQDRIENLSSLHKAGNHLRLRVQGPAAKVTESLRRVNALKTVRYEHPDHVVVYDTGQEPRGEITKLLVDNGWTLLAMESEEMSLEEIFLKLTAESEA